jgi:hypothetical protein
MQSRRDPRVEPDDPANADEREDHYVARSDDAHPESVKRRTSRPPRSRTAPEFRAEPSPAVETSDLVELPVDAVTSYARARASSVRPPPSEPMKSARSRAVSYRPPAETAPAPRAPSNANVVTNLDPRLEQIEPIIDEGNWHTVGQQLGALEDSGRLPPTLGLIAAVAHSEIAGDAGCPDANDLAIRCMTGVFGIKSDSAIGRVLAKRLLRRNQRVAPVRATVPASAAFVLFAVFLAVGLIGGYLIGSGTLKVPF